MKFKIQENMNLIPYEYKDGFQMFLETPGIIRKLSMPYTGPYPVMYGIIRIQKLILSNRVSIR
jgi:hypothetical protein